MQDFINRFCFKKDSSFKVGVERECFLTTSNGTIIPIAPKVLDLLPDRNRFGYELSACQLEDRIGPCDTREVLEKFSINESEIKPVESRLGFRRLYTEVAPSNIPLDVFPDPTGRYQEITRGMPHETLLAACRVAATHIHVGMPNRDIALKIYNKAIKHVDRLCKLGSGLNEQRLSIYKTMAPDCIPETYSGWEHFYEESIRKGFHTDPRRCWHLIRISVHGTIEFRMFGSTPRLKQIGEWVEECHSICKEALKS